MPEYFSDRDSKENAKARVPTDESIVYHCLWLTELYTPAEADRFLTRLDAMRSSMRGSQRDDVREWVTKMRGRPFSAGFHAIGYLVPKDGRR
jgi:hypothetical protein